MSQARRLLLSAVTIVAMAILWLSVARADDWDICAKEAGDAAISACTRAITSSKYDGNESNKLSALYNNRGVEYENKGDYDRAIADYNEAIKLNSKYEQAYRNRSDTYKKRGDDDRAIADYSAVIEINPSYANFIHRGSLYFHHGQYNLAADDWSEAIRLDPQHPFGWLNRCEVYVVQNKLQEALSDCNKSLEISNVPEARRIRGILYTKLGRYELAISDFDDALKAVPTFAGALYARGVAKLKSGDARSGQADIEKAQSMETRVGDDFKIYGLAF